MSDLHIEIVPDQPCPGCGAYWGHPDPKLDFPNRPKVDNHWKCYNPECEVGYYLDGEIVELKLSPDEAKAQAARISAEVDQMMKGRHFEEYQDPNLPPGIKSFRLVADAD